MSSKQRQPMAARRRTARGPLAVVGLLALVSVASAGDRYRPVDFSLALGRTKVDLDYPNATVPTDIDRIGIHWRERYGRLLLGAAAGYSFVTQKRNAATAGDDPRGYHFGLNFDVTLHEADRFALAVGGAYLYERVEVDNDTDEVDLRWYIPSAQLVGRWQLTPHMQLTAGPRYDALHGRQQTSAATNTRQEIERSARGGGIVGLRLQLDETGYVSIEGTTGALRGVTLHFGRQF